MNVKNYTAISIALENPLDLDGKTVHMLSMRPPTCGDVLNAQSLTQNEAQMDVLLFANLCGVTQDFIKGLAIFDYRQLEAAYSRFLFPVRMHFEMRSLPLHKDLAAPVSAS